MERCLFGVEGDVAPMRRVDLARRAEQAGAGFRHPQPPQEGRLGRERRAGGKGARQRRRRRGDLDAQFGGAGKGRRAQGGEDAERAAPPRREQEPARGGEVVKTGVQKTLGDNGRAGAAFQRLLHRRQRLARAPRADQGDMREVRPRRRESAPIGQAEFAGREILDDEEERAPAPRPPRRPRQSQREDGRRRRVRRAGGQDFAQAPPRRQKRREKTRRLLGHRDPRRGRRALARLKGGDAAAQKGDAFRNAALRHR